MVRIIRRIVGSVKMDPDRIKFESDQDPTHAYSRHTCNWVLDRSWTVPPLRPTVPTLSPPWEPKNCPPPKAKKRQIVPPLIIFGKFFEI